MTCPLRAASFLPSLQLALHISIVQSQKPDVLVDVCKGNIARGDAKSEWGFGRARLKQ